jgi:hypothetical protein
MNMRLGGPWRLSGCLGEEKNLLPLPGIKPLTIKPIGKSLLLLLMCRYMEEVKVSKYTCQKHNITSPTQLYILRKTIHVSDYIIHHQAK